MRRKHLRNLCAELLKVRWKDGSGQAREEYVTLEDISTTGACVQLEVEIPVGTAVTLVHPQATYEGVVRHCQVRHTLYFIGIEFAEGSRWSPRSFKPTHMLQLWPRRVR